MDKADKQLIDNIKKHEVNVARPSDVLRLVGVIDRLSETIKRKDRNIGVLKLAVSIAKEELDKYEELIGKL